MLLISFWKTEESRIMKRYIIFTLIWYVNTAFAQELDFKYVVVPDTFAKLLDESYGHSPCGASVNVHNMEDYENTVWKNGIFSYKGMGPHFPRKLFIYENNCLFAFRNWGYDVKSVLAEFMACVDSLHLDKDKIVKYLSIICQYLNEEKDDTYGAFVKPELNEESSVNGLSDNNDGTRLVLDDSARIAERLMYLPTGEVFKDEQNNTLYHSDFLFSGKELDAETGNYYYGARYYAPRIGIWLSPDPLQLKYPHVSSYAYCMGNPVRLIDPTGKDVLIWYKDSRGNDQLFRFNGTQSKMPKGNQFIKDFIQAYNYLKYTGGGENLRNAVENPKYEIYVDNAELFDKFGTEFYKYDVPTVYWESRKGIQFKDGSQSPATRLEHEFDHAIDYLEHTHDHRQRQGKNDSQYGNAEERRVITGSERRTAKANHEAVRHHHTGTVYETKSPITTEKKTNYE